MSSSAANPLSNTSVAIIGGGIIGLSSAWRLAEAGAKVTVYDRQTLGRGASWAAAGMLSPAFEAASEPETHPSLFELCLQSARLWPDFAARLERITGQTIGYSPGPSLALAGSKEQETHLMLISEKLHEHGLEHQMMDGAACRQIEPSITSSEYKSLLLPSDGQVDNRAIIKALIHVCQNHPSIKTVEQAQISSAQDLRKDHNQVVVTAGWQTKELLSEHIAIGPVAGQLLSIAPTAGSPKHTLRMGKVYVAPKHDRIVIGATVEPGKVSPEPELEKIERLRAEAAQFCPSLLEGEVLEMWSGTRPATPDGAPIIDDVSPGVIVASGHYRNGVLLAPVTADLITRRLSDNTSFKEDHAFRRNRFSAKTH